MEKTLKILFNIFRVLLGLVLIFSGFSKGVDPLGTAYKFNEYFASVGLPEMDNMSLIFSFLMNSAEFLIGVALVTGIFFNLTAWTALLFYGFFTVLTFLLAVFNPVTDCGCFGDALKISNWATFYKNVVFIVLISFVFIRRKKFIFYSHLWVEWATLIITILVIFSISVYSYRHLPIVDFIPYSTGSNISEKMKIPAGAPIDEYETILTYKNLKSGKTEDFTMNNYPWQDSLNWKWAGTKSVLKKKGYTPPIHDFSISTPEGNNITEPILSDTSYTFLFIAYNINKADPTGLSEAERIKAYCEMTNNCKFYAVTASASNDVMKIKNLYGISYNFNSGDETALKTAIRSNPGLILLKNGTVLGKWHYNDMKEIAFRNGNFFSECITKLRKSGEWTLSIAIIFGLWFVLSLIWAVSLRIKNKEQGTRSNE
jgi:uncharacterized membrane protein YphA (DoxX/SURF4 family)